eukprot:scaffold4469_cov193-Prasinococcus_capsulatus_cf.AAC.2
MATLGLRWDVTPVLLIVSAPVSGNLGADGFGTAEWFELQSEAASGVPVRAFIKKVFGTGDPSVNHIIMVQDTSGLGQSAAVSSDFDDHAVTGLENLPVGSMLVYVLFGSNDAFGVDVSPSAFQEIVDEIASFFG